MLVFENLMIWQDEVLPAGSARFPGNNKIFQPYVSSFGLLSNGEIGFLMRETAEFWIELDDRFLCIRYFVVRNAKGLYRGTLEVSQNLTAPQTGVATAAAGLGIKESGVYFLWFNP